MHPGQLRTAFILSWLFVSCLLVFVLAAPHLLPHNLILDATPACEAKTRFNTECSLCGMTTAFLRIAEGDMQGAANANRAGVALYGVFLLNELAAIVALRRWWPDRTQFLRHLRR